MGVKSVLRWGEASHWRQVKSFQAFMEMVPHAEYVDVKGAAHMIAGDKNDVFTDAVVSFLDR